MERSLSEFLQFLPPANTDMKLMLSTAVVGFI